MEWRALPDNTKPIRKNPHLYEINLMTWLHELSRREGRDLNLGDIPPEEWMRLRAKGVDIVWLMGIWERSPYSRRTARSEPFILDFCRSVFPEYDPEDVAGSPYAVRRYVPDPSLGSVDQLARLKKTLEAAGLLLVLDFVPNHTACDHPWIEEHPDRYVGEPRDGNKDCRPGFFPAPPPSTDRCIAHGKDPYFPPWSDTAQLNYTNPNTIMAMKDTLVEISPLCHGFRCDMAMLVMKEVFIKTWEECLIQGATVDEEFWPLVTRKSSPTPGPMIWVSEAYWGLEEELLRQGFGFVYDKTFYDALLNRDVRGLKSVLSLDVERQQRRLRFLENHDEERAAHAFGPDRIRSAMVVHATVPGMRLWHHGQFQGSRLRVPVQLRRRPLEPVDRGIQAFFEMLLREVDQPVFHQGHWRMCGVTGWPDNPSCENLLAWCWKHGEERRLVIVNLSSYPAQGYVTLPVEWFSAGEHFLFTDPLEGSRFLHKTIELQESGLYVDLDQGRFHFLKVQRG